VTLDETIDLLTTAAAFDRRTVGEADAIAWHAAIGDLSFDDSRAAVVAHYTETSDWVMPAHVRARVRAMRRDRLTREIIPALPAEIADQPSRYRGELRERIREIADGHSVQHAITPVPAQAPRAVAVVRGELGPALPPAERTLAPQEIARRQAAESRAARGAQLTAVPSPGESE
jgi:hypothetical protein